MPNTQATISGIDELLESYEMESQLYRLLCEVTELQLSALRSGARSADFFALVENKQNLLRAIDHLEQASGPIRRRWLDYAADEDPCKRSRLNDLLDGILFTIEKIGANEEESQALLADLEGYYLTHGAQPRTAVHASLS